MRQKIEHLDKVKNQATIEAMIRIYTNTIIFNLTKFLSVEEMNQVHREKSLCSLYATAFDILKDDWAKWWQEVKHIVCTCFQNHCSYVTCEVKNAFFGEIHMFY